MTDQTPEPTEQATLPPAFAPDPTSGFLTVEQMLESARRPRRVAKICLRGDIEAEYLELLDELGDLVDAEGQILSDDPSMEEAGKVADLRDQIAAKHAEMRANTGQVLLEAMADEDWEIFDKKHRGPDGSVKDRGAWQAEMVAACAIKPTISVQEFTELRKKLGPTSIAELANKAYSANTTGGVDIPKLPSFSVAPKPQGQSLS